LASAIDSKFLVVLEDWKSLLQIQNALVEKENSLFIYYIILLWKAWFQAFVYFKDTVFRFTSTVH